MPKPLPSLFVLLLLASMLAGCGQKGPLVLPDQETPPAQERR